MTDNKQEERKPKDSKYSGSTGTQTGWGDTDNKKRKRLDIPDQDAQQDGYRPLNLREAHYCIWRIRKVVHSNMS